MPNRFPRTSLVVLAAALAGCAGDSASPPTAASSHLGHGSPSLAAGAAATDGALVAQVRRATARFHRIEVAFAEGYVQGSPCEVSATGGMGAHFRKNALIDGVIGYVDCTIHDVHEAGDHFVVIGRVQDMDLRGPGEAEPLLYFEGQYRTTR